MAFARRYRSDALLSEAKKIVVASLIALNAGACSLTLGVAGIQDDEPEATGSVASQAVVSLSPDLDEEDWRRAKAALALALDPQGPGTLVSWDNPASTTKGSFLAAGAPFVKNDEICRAFSASLTNASLTTLQGTACRPSGGEWVLKDVKPAKPFPKA